MRILSFLLDVIFPRTCPICRQPLYEEQVLCSECMARLNRTEQALQRDNETEACFVHQRHFAWGGCWLFYQKNTPLQKVIHRAKFGQGNPLLWYQLGVQAAKDWQDTGFFDSIDWIVPMPLHKRRLRERGFNQSEWIAKGLSSVLLIPMDTEHLTRYKFTKMQSMSSFEERQKGVNNAFRINHPEEWYGKTILLVDDIITTGATMRSAMDAFEHIYGCKIVVFALAKTK